MRQYLHTSNIWGTLILRSKFFEFSFPDKKEYYETDCYNNSFNDRGGFFEFAFVSTRIYLAMRRLLTFWLTLTRLLMWWFLFPRRSSFKGLLRSDILSS